MKKLFIIALMFVAVLACSQNVVYKDSATVQWTHPDVGDAHFVFEVYIFDYSVGVVDDQDTAALTLVDTVGFAELLITFPFSTEWAVGVRTKFTDDNAQVKFSAIAWSYNTGDADLVSGPFLYSPSFIPVKPGALKDLGT